MSRPHDAVDPKSLWSEEMFQEQVLQKAFEFGWLAFHTRESRGSHFGRILNNLGKPVSLRGGFPDLILLRERIIAAELKVGNNTLSETQWHWLNAFKEAGGEIHVWRPEDWDDIELVLKTRGA